MGVAPDVDVSSTWALRLTWELMHVTPVTLIDLLTVMRALDQSLQVNLGAISTNPWAIASHNSPG